MTTDPRYEHLGQLLTLMREEMSAGFSEIKTALADRVSVAVYRADRRLDAERLDRLAAELADARAEIDQARRDQAEERHRAEERRAADRRMLWGALLGAALSLVVTITATLAQTALTSPFRARLRGSAVVWRSMPRAYISVGHGRRSSGVMDPGATTADGRKSEQSEGSPIARACAARLRELGVTVKLNDAGGPDFAGAAAEANRWGADVAVEIHHDWHGAPRGCFGFWYP